MNKKLLFSLFLLYFFSFLGFTQNDSSRLQCNSYIFNSNPLIITNDTIISGINRFNRDIIINSNVNVTVNDTLFLGDSVHIIVNAGATLTLSSCTLTNLCDNIMWEGIILNYALTSQNRAHLISTNSTIENAKIAILTNGYIMGINYFAGYINATNTTFRNNKESINILNNSGSNNSVFNVCSFTINDNNNFDVTNAFSNHVKLSHADDIYFFGCTFNNLTDTLNTGTYRGRGIYALSSKFTVDEYCTSYSSDTICICNVSSMPSIFERLGYGIEAITDGTNKLMTVQRSNFICNGYNIKTSALNNYIITHCDIFLHRYYSEGTYGIHSSNCSGYTISDNNFECLYHLYQNYGVYIFNSGTSENLINNNSFYRLLYGIYSDSLNGSPNLSGAGLQIQCNSFNIDDLDIVIARRSRIRAYQGLEAEGADNDFVNNCLLGCYNIYNNNNNSNLKYFYSGDSSNIHFPPHIFNVTLFQNAGNNICSHSYCINETDYDKNGQLNKYRLLNTQYIILLNEYEQNDYETILKDYFNNGIINDKDKLNKALTLLSQIQQTSSLMYNISKSGINYVLSSSKDPDLAELQQWYLAINTLQSYYYLIEIYIEQNNYQDAEKILQSIPSKFYLRDDELQEYQNYVDLFYLKEKVYFAGKNLSKLSNDEISELSVIATKTEGLSAGIAKNILCFYYNICFEDRELELPDEKIHPCENDMSTIHTNNSKINVFPNPFDNTISINSINSGNIIITDISGKIILQKNISIGSTKIDSSLWQKGIYIVTVITNNNITTNKVIKL